MAFERDTLHPGCIFGQLNDNQSTLAAVAMKYADGQNWEEDLAYRGINFLFQKWSTELSVLTNREARLNHFK